MFKVFLECRVCKSRELEEYDIIHDQLLDVTSFWDRPVDVEKASIVFYKCKECGHFQIDVKLEKEYYSEIINELKCRYNYEGAILYIRNGKYILEKGDKTYNEVTA